MLIVTPGNYPKENVLHTEHGESLKSRSQGENLIKLHALREFYATFR